MAAASHVQPYLTLGGLAGQVDIIENEFIGTGLKRFIDQAIPIKASYITHKGKENSNCEQMSFVYVILALVAAAAGATFIALSGGPSNLQLFVPGAVCGIFSIGGIVMFAVCCVKASCHKTGLKKERENKLNEEVDFQEFLNEVKNPENTIERVVAAIEGSGRTITTRFGMVVNGPENRLSLLRKLLEQFSEEVKEDSIEEKIFSAFPKFVEDVVSLSKLHPQLFKPSIVSIILKTSCDAQGIANAKLKEALAEFLDAPYDSELLRHNPDLLATIAAREVKEGEEEEFKNRLVSVISKMKDLQKIEFLNKAKPNKILPSVILESILNQNFLALYVQNEEADKSHSSEEENLYQAIVKSDGVMPLLFIQRTTPEALEFLQIYYAKKDETSKKTFAAVAGNVILLEGDSKKVVKLCRDDIEDAADNGLKDVVRDVYAQTECILANAESLEPELSPAQEKVVTIIREAMPQEKKKTYEIARIASSKSNSTLHPVSSSSSRSEFSLSSLNTTPKYLKQYNSLKDAKPELDNLIRTSNIPTRQLHSFLVKNPGIVREIFEDESLGEKGARVSLTLHLLSCLDVKTAEFAIEQVDVGILRVGFPNFNFLAYHLKEEIEAKIGNTKAIEKLPLDNELLVKYSKLAHYFVSSTLVNKKAFFGNDDGVALKTTREFGLMRTLAERYPQIERARNLNPPPSE